MVVILAERAADERRADAGQRLDLIVAGVHVCDDLVGGEGIIMIMRVGVVHELIAAVHDGLGLFGILIRPVAHDKKGTGDTVLLEHVEDLLRVVRAPRRVKRDGAHLLVALDTVDRQLARRGRRTDGGGIIDGGKDRRGGQHRRALTNGDTESPKTQSYTLKIVGVVSEESEDYMLQYGITFRLNDLLMLSEAYSKLAKTDFNPKKVTYNEVYIKVDDIKNVDKICDTLKEEGYQISSMVDYRKQMQQQTAQRQLRLAGLAAISLFVAALNIANTMTMAIYERTREIGVMKVLGCEIGNIRRMFLIESGMIGFIGGVAGTILSYIISFGMNNMTMIVYGLNTLLMKLGINATIDLSSLMGSSDSMYYGGGFYMSDSGSGTVMSIIPFWLVLAAIGFAVVVGLLSGIVPASRAVRISALEAIRHD